MSKRSDRDLLSDIRVAVERITAYTAKLQYEAFIGDTKTQDAVIRNLEILGEAAKKVSNETRQNIRIYPGRTWLACAIG
jgi:uncharacterized protein with HEPN domain